MNKKSLWLFTILFVGAVATVEAQQPRKMPRIGYLSNSDPTSDSARSRESGLLCASFPSAANKHFSQLQYP